MRLILAFIFLSQLLVAQNFNGIVLGIKTNQPVENVTVCFKKGAIGTTTNASGKFTLTIKPITSKRDSLQFSRICYHTKTIALKKFKKGKTTVYLSKKIENLDQVVVNTSKGLKTSINYKTLTQLKSGVYAFGSQIIGDSIYVVSGSSSNLEDSGKKALQAINDIPNPSFGDFMKELQRGNNYESYNDKLQVYVIKNNKWYISETPFRKRTFHNLNRYKNELYSLGGKRVSPIRKYEYLDNKIEVFDLASKEITIDNTNPHQAINFASFIYQDNIIVMGGSTKLKRNGNKTYTGAAHIYNITSGLWYELPKMRLPKETQGVIVDHKIYLIGGHSGNKLKTIESYNITTGTWTNEGDLFNEMAHPGLTTHEHIIYIFNDEKLLIFNTITKALEEYDINLKLKNSKLHYFQDKLYIVGGFTENSHTIAASSQLYEIDFNEFDKTLISRSKKVN
ncbi:MAG: hypothetical protein ACJA1H_000489 [Glaciecola sp.]|jgi:hypothetical protein